MPNDKPIKRTLSLGEAQAVRRFNAAKRDLADAEARKKKYEAEIREFLGDATQGVDEKGNKLVAVVSHPGQNRANLAALELFPEAYAAVVTRTGYTYLK